jgi:protein-S-isoprenylcysteine O-methyltransferase Ste14
MSLFIILLSVSILTHVVRTTYEFLKIHGKINPENKFVFPIIFLNMVILWVSWFNLSFMDPVKFLLPAFIGYAGIVIFLAGMVFFVWSLAQIKRFENYHGDLVTHGIYKYFRHPMYISFILWMVGSSLYNQSAIAMILAIIYSINIWIWKSLEEIQLVKTFPGYPEYRKTTWF